MKFIYDFTTKKSDTTRLSTLYTSSERKTFTSFSNENGDEEERREIRSDVVASGALVFLSRLDSLITVII